jgi:RND family efflux transporter MFP subunit
MATQVNSLKPDLGSLRIHDGERKGAKTGKILGFAALGLVIVAAVAAAAYTFRNQKIQVEVATVQPPSSGPAGVLNASGYITPRRRATIAAKITGRVTGIFFDEGTRLHQGQLLATLDDSDVRRSLESAKADRDSAEAAIADFQVQLRNAEIELKRAEQLHDAGVQTQEALDNARTSSDSLRAKIALAKQQVVASAARIAVAQQAVDNCTIRAPFAGIAVSKDAQVGEMVSPNSAGGGFTRTGIATIVDMKSNEIEVDVNESYIARVQNGQLVTATLDAYPDKPIPAKVRTVIPTADRQKATVKVRITIISLEKYDFILPDMGVKVAFLEEQKPAAKEKGRDSAGQPVAFVPKGAVRSDAGTAFVFLVRDGKAERRAISLGPERGSDVAVMAGLSPGDSLIVKGAENLHDGDKVEIRQ